MQTQKVSIIIPVYGVEKYLEQCLRSVGIQTYTNIEILVIDDGSPDRSGLIADAYAIADHRIKVCHIDNRGAAGARNVGLDYASGDCIMFVDGDDWLEPDAVEQLMIKLNTDISVDVVQCQYFDEWKTRTKRHEFLEGDEVISSELFVKGMVDHWEYIVIWNKLYRREVLEHLRFTEGRCIDDEFFTYRWVLKKTVRIAQTHQYLYHYRQRLSGAMKNPDKQIQRYRDQVDFITERYQPLCNAYPELRTVLRSHLIEVLMQVIRNGAADVSTYKYAKKALWHYGLPGILDISLPDNIRKSLFFYLLYPRKKWIIQYADTTENKETEEVFD